MIAAVESLGSGEAGAGIAVQTVVVVGAAAAAAEAVAVVGEAAAVGFAAAAVAAAAAAGNECSAADYPAAMVLGIGWKLAAVDTDSSFAAVVLCLGRAGDLAWAVD
jgi:hypothetical protein